MVLIPADFRTPPPSIISLITNLLSKAVVYMVIKHLGATMDKGDQDFFIILYNCQLVGSGYVEFQGTSEKSLT